METEDLTEFREIPGYEGLYSVNLINQVKSHGRWIRNNKGKSFIPERILKNNIHKITGHLRVTLYKNGVKEGSRIHNLVALAWNLPKKEGDNCVEHKDDNPEHNHYDNLMWSNQSNNTINGHYRSSKHKIKAVLQYDLQGNFIARHESVSSAQNIFTPGNLNGGSIVCCLTRSRRKSAYGFIWKYENEPLIEN